MEPCGTPTIVSIHELKTKSSFILWCLFEFKFLLVLDYHDLNHRRAV